MQFQWTLNPNLILLALKHTRTHRAIGHFFKVVYKVNRKTNYAKKIPFTKILLLYNQINMNHT